MTDRYHSLTVALDEDIRDDDAEAIISAIKVLKHVIAVEGNVTSPDQFTTRVRMLHNLRSKLWDVLDEMRKEGF